MPKMSLTRALGFGLLTAALASTGACGGGDDDNKSAAVVKFCNPLSLQNNRPLDLTLEVGSDKPVIVTAASGTCVPAAKARLPEDPGGQERARGAEDGRRQAGPGHRATTSSRARNG